MAESSGNHLYDLLDSKSSSAETTDRSDQNDEMESVVARSYECVFCKRGFTTAQALGGHMNIHRKDRAKTTRHHRSNINDPNLVSSSNKFGEENYATNTFKSFLAIQSYPPLQCLAAKAVHHEGIHVNYQTYNIPMVPATWGNVTNARVSPPEVLLNGGDHDPREYLSLGIGMTLHEEEEGIDNEETLEDHHDDNKLEKISGRDYIEDVKVDLELRLGYDP